MNRQGRPPKFNSPEQLQELMDSYFTMCEEKDIPPFWTDLAVYLDTNRETLSDYAKKDEFSDTIKKAKAKCEAAVERGMMTNKMNATAAIFNLKNNYGWEDRQKIDNTHSVNEETKDLIQKALEDI